MLIKQIISENFPNREVDDHLLRDCVFGYFNLDSTSQLPYYKELESTEVKVSMRDENEFTSVRYFSGQPYIGLRSVFAFQEKHGRNPSPSDI